MDADLYHIVIYAPLTHAKAIRDALATSGAGSIGNYDSCSFSSRGTGRFRATAKADPHVGSKETAEEVEEERIEAVAPKEILRDVLGAVTKAHPYEEPAILVLPMVDYHQFLSS